MSENKITMKVRRHRPTSTILSQQVFNEDTGRHFILQIDLNPKQDFLDSVNFKKVKNVLIDDDLYGSNPKVQEDDQIVKVKRVLWNGKDAPAFNRNITGSYQSTNQRKQLKLIEKQSYTAQHSFKQAPPPTAKKTIFSMCLGDKNTKVQVRSIHRFKERN